MADFYFATSDTLLVIYERPALQKIRLLDNDV